MRRIMKEIREEMGLTHEQVAKKLGVARTTYTNIELGVKNPSFDKMIKLKKLFHTESDDIFLNFDVPKCNNE